MTLCTPEHDKKNTEAARLLATVAELGGLLALDGDSVLLTTPTPAPPELLEAVRQYKAALLALLRSGQAADLPPPGPTPPDPEAPPLPPSPPPPPLPGWPPGVIVPAWWAELAGPMRDVLVEAAGHTCPDCGFTVAVRWQSSDDGALRWACPRCGLHAGAGERPGTDAELPPVVRRQGSGV